MAHNFIRGLTEIRLLMTRDETRSPRKLLLVLEKQICTLMSGAEEQSKQLPYVMLRPVWSRERLFLWQLRSGRAQRGPRTVPWHGFLQTDPGQSNSQREGAAGGPEEARAAGLCCALTAAEGLCPAPPGRLPVLGPARSREGPVRAAGPGRPSSPSQCPGHSGEHRAGIERPSLPSAGSRAPFYITGGSAAVTQRAAGLPRPGRGTGGTEGRGSRMSSSAAMAAPSPGSPPLPAPGPAARAAGGQLPFPPCLPPPLPATATPSPPPHHRGAGCRRRAPSQPVPSLGSFSFLFFSFPPSLPPCLPPRPGSEFCLSRPGTRLP